MRVLLVDDEGSLLMTLAANLELEGFEVVEADSGARALELFEGGAFDLVLSDVRMPGMNGVELFRRIRRRRPEVPVVLMTAFALEELVDAAIDEGAFTVLSKPFTVPHAVATLTRASRRPLVLVVDGEVADAASTVEALRKIGVAAATASDEESALRVVRDANVDACVVDLAREGTRLRLIEQVLAWEPPITVIAVAGPAVHGLLQRAAALGAFACLSKPADAVQLVRVIARARAAGARSRSMNEATPRRP